MKQLRDAVKEKLERENLSLRQASEECAVSFSSLSRFLRGADLSWKLFESLEQYVEGKRPAKRREVMVRRFTIGKKTFLVRIEEIEQP